MNLTRKSSNIKKLNQTLAVIIVIVCVVKSESSEEHKVIETKNGKVRGLLKTTLFKKVDYFSFKGIPYAKSPTGELRFKAPEPVEPWTPRVRDAFEHGPICMQTVWPAFGNEKKPSEDCLFLNVYVPAATTNEKLPVMVFVHGGGYVLGSGNDNLYGPDFLIEQSVILVTVNYRLGVLGFMSLGTPEYSGNMGLKDQQLALKWIHSNIEHFSGDNQRITLFGESAGSSSTHFHTLSSESRKYFRNAILMSGTVDNLWAMYEKNDHLSQAYEIAERMGLESQQSLEELIDFMKTAPAEKVSEYGTSWARTFILEMSPIVEKKDAIRPFIVESPDEIYDQTKIEVDALFTFCSIEFLFFYTKADGEIRDLKGLDRNFSLVLPFRGVDLAFDSLGYQQIAQEIRELYFADAPVDDKSLKQYLDLLSDINFANGVDRSAKRHAAKTNSNTFYLRFAVNSKLSTIHREKFGDDLQGATDLAAHMDDLYYVFRSVYVQQIYDEILSNKDGEQSKITLQAIENMTKLFSNFAKYGKPTHNGQPIAEFLPIQKDRVNFLDVTNSGLKMGIDPNHQANQLWTRIERKIRRIGASVQPGAHEEL